MTTDLLHQASDRLTSEFSPTWLELDQRTGLPIRIGSAQTGEVDLAATFSLVLGGTEHRGMHGELDYDGCSISSDLHRTGRIRDQLCLDGRLYTVPIQAAGWYGTLCYQIGSASPEITWSWRLVPGPNAEVLRDVRIGLDVQLPDDQAWTCQLPGAPVRPDLRLDELPPSVVMDGLGGTRGSAGLIAVTDPRPTTLVVWPRCVTESGTTAISRIPGGIRLAVSTRLAAAPQDGLELNQSGIALTLQAAGWDTVRGTVGSWLDDLGIRTPRDRAPWTAGATIYEAQIGRSLFAGGTWTYSPYPTVADLLADLPRVHDLGFDTIQLMPRQPFPSYGVIDYDDIATSYGDLADLRTAITWCHDHGMRFILDVLMHGVIDKESIAEVAASVRDGRWSDLVHADASVIDDLQLSSEDQRTLSWSRHILDFEQAWRDGSPARHPLTAAHPEWFCRDSSGKVIGVYTKAFDLSHPGWQSYFSDKMVALVRELDIDGFRFDAPGYNHFPNWSPRTRARASVQELGALPLFRTLRRTLHELDPDLMLYTEPNTPLFREAMDLNYNYDETWLPDSIFGRGGDHPGSRVRNARDLARWLTERDATLPEGSVTAHHLDSHDTFWWPLPGSKWRREQIGRDASRALMTAFALSGGPYMMFVGGEDGMQEQVAAVNRIRASRPELAHGSHRFGMDGVVSDDLFLVRHQSGDNRSVLLANLSNRSVTEDLRHHLPGAWQDLLGTRPVADSTVELAPYAAAFWVVAR